MCRGGRSRNSSGFSQQDGVPSLVVDPMEDIEDEEREEREDLESYLKSARAKTVFHQPRGENDTVNSTRSLYDTDVIYTYICGRRFCGDYCMPNDEDEQTRLQILHDLYLYILDNRLTLAPLHNPRKILDIGTGTGEWAMAMGEEYPDAEVTGTDIAKTQPSAVPLNVFFEIDDAEEEGGWTWPEDEFDLIHMRSMVAAFTDWNHIYREAYKHIKPGGWIEVMDFDNHRGLMSYFDDDSEVRAWLMAIEFAAGRSGRPRSVDHLSSEALTSVGFVDVKTSSYDLAMGSWPEDKEEQKLAKHFLVAQLSGVEALCLRPFAEQLGWDINEIRRMCDRVVAEVKAVAVDPERSRGMAFKIKIILGRKPDASSSEVTVGGTTLLRPPPTLDDGDDDGESVNTLTNTNRHDE